jgi:phosphoglycolate phosphatase
MKYSLVMFDFDGTLADTLPFVADLLDQLIEEFDLQKISSSERDELRELDARQILQKYHVPFWKMASMVRRVRGLMAQESHKVKLFDGVEETLTGLAEKGATLAMVSSNSAENVQAVLGPRLFPLFRYSECGSSMFGKPPRIRKILRLSGIPGGQAISIGDEVRDIEAARAARVASGAVTWGYGNPATLVGCQPDLVFEKVGQLLERLG